jgi:hypothetical protein
VAAWQTVADARDRAAEARDRAAGARDRAAELRRERAGALAAGELGLAEALARAAQDRAGATRDRTAAAEDRVQAAEDRVDAVADRARARAARPSLVTWMRRGYLATLVGGSPAGQLGTIGGGPWRSTTPPRDGCVIATFTGSIDLVSVSVVRRTLLKELAEQPDGLICDLSGVDHLDPVCATVFATVGNHRQSLADRQLRLVRRPTAGGRGPGPPPGPRRAADRPDPTAPAAARAFVGGSAATGRWPCPTARWWSGRCCWPMGW